MCYPWHTNIRISIPFQISGSSGLVVLTHHLTSVLVSMKHSKVSGNPPAYAQSSSQIQSSISKIYGENISKWQIHLTDIAHEEWRLQSSEEANLLKHQEPFVEALVDMACIALIYSALNLRHDDMVLPSPLLKCPDIRYLANATSSFPLLSRLCYLRQRPQRPDFHTHRTSHLHLHHCRTLSARRGTGCQDHP